ncbi:Rid family detoxifying hydrolase [Alkalihalobacillus oceani]|uniref:Rid family detoxifying hydrolase n=1 Tax=Halalkalibacter oceani TaxID=1653776 RepID=A0A9X2DM31_9BACI|nr:Rid family detoxifying hydrolase [Halalkalibacter oceani]MCM3712996.1 Rid family detoxifying hydrolase [Halalkalibacter oceani]
MKTNIFTSLAPQPVGAFSQGLKINNRIYVAGQTPVNVETGEIPESIEEQTRQVMENIKHILKAGNAMLSDVVKVTTYLNDINDFDRYNKVYKEFFEEPYPVRTTVGVALKDIPIEIDVIAEI